MQKCLEAGCRVQLLEIAGSLYYTGWFKLITYENVNGDRLR